jgi:cyclase
MRQLRWLILAAGILFASRPAMAQDRGGYAITPLNDHLYELSIDGGGYTVKVLASVGGDGLLLLETGQERSVEQLKAALQTLTDAAPKIIISSHEHVEHLGGNAAFGNDPLVIGHAVLKTRLRSGSYLFEEFPDASLPDITFTDSMSVFFNGEEIKLIAFPGAHTDNDIIVWFTGSKVVYVGAISNGTHFPSVDEESGNALQYAPITQAVIGMLPEDVAIIPGHGADGTMAEFRALHDMLVKTTAIVKAGLDAGKDLETLQTEDVLKDWAAFDGSYVDRNAWLKYLVSGFHPVPSKKTLYEPMYYALKEGGADAAIAKYRDLKKNKPDEYGFTEDELVIIAYEMFTHERMPEAIKLFDLCTREFPKGTYTGKCYDYMGRAYEAQGDKDLALKSYKACLKLMPDRAYAAERVAALTKQ